MCSGKRSVCGFYNTCKTRVVELKFIAICNVYNISVNDFYLCNKTHGTEGVPFVPLLAEKQCMNLIY